MMSRARIMEEWSVGVIKHHWSAGVLECWSDVRLKNNENLLSMLFQCSSTPIKHLTEIP
jgi:hypothetical protein